MSPTEQDLDAASASASASASAVKSATRMSANLIVYIRATPDTDQPCQCWRFAPTCKLHGVYSFIIGLLPFGFKGPWILVLREQGWDCCSPRL